MIVPRGVVSDHTKLGGGTPVYSMAGWSMLSLLGVVDLSVNNVGPLRSCTIQHHQLAVQIV